MENEQTIIPDSSASELVSEGGNNNGVKESSEELALKSVNEFLGMQYKSLTDAQKAIKDSIKFSQEGGKVKKSVESFAKANNLSFEETLNYFNNLGSIKSPEGEKSSEVETKLQKIEKEIEWERSIRKQPELESYRDIIDALAATKNIPLSEAANDPVIKELIEAKKIQKDSENKKSAILNSNSRLGGQELQKLNDLSKDYKNKSSDKTAEEIVKTYFGGSDGLRKSLKI